MRWLLMNLLALASLATAAPPADLVKAELFADVKSIRPGTPFQVALQLRIAPGWHIYWLNPGEGGLPTTATLVLPAGLKASAFAYPTPITFDLPGGLTAYGYEAQATLLATVTPAPDFDAERATIRCNANWMVCKDVCVAGKASPTVSLPQKADRDDPAELFRQAISLMPLSAADAARLGTIEPHLALQSDGKAGELTVSLSTQSGGMANVQFFPPPTQTLTFAKSRVDQAAGKTTIITPFEVLAGEKLPAGTIDSVVSWKQNDQTVGVTVPIHFESATLSGK